MVFADVLRELTERVDGWVGLVVMGLDGIPIERLAIDEGVNFEALAAECTALLKNTRQTSEEVGAGTLREIVITTEHLVILAIAITDDYILLGAMRRGSNHGLARYVMRRASLRLEKEFA
jgi:predicted regulator of Ras-like GTPase activity (Roadblock/LC7/MglB family)